MMENYYAFVVVVVVVVEAMERKKRAGLAFVYCIFIDMRERLGTLYLLCGSCIL